MHHTHKKLDLYIKIENGVPVTHPALKQNLLDVFGKIPENWAPFERTLIPEHMTSFESQNIKSEYTLMGDGVTWTDNWKIIDSNET